MAVQKLDLKRDAYYSIFDLAIQQQVKMPTSFAVIYLINKAGYERDMEVNL